MTGAPSTGGPAPAGLPGGGPDDTRFPPPLNTRVDPGGNDARHDSGSVVTRLGVRRGSRAFAIALPAWGQPAPEKKPAVFEVMVPANADVEVDGQKTQAAGETRRFESPPVAVGGTYAYAVRATWQGKVVERTVKIRPDRVTTVDLRDELRAVAVPPHSAAPQIVPQTAPPRAVVTPPPAAQRPEPQPTAPALPLPPAAQKAEPRPSAPSLPAPPAAPPRPGTAKPQPLPATADLGLDVPQEVVLPPGGVSYIDVRVRATGDAPLAGLPGISIGPAGGGLRIDPWSSAFAPDRTTFARAYVVRAATDAAEGERMINVAATAGTAKAEGAVKIVVRKREPPAVSAVRPELTLPAEVVLSRGAAGQFEVRVGAAAGATFSAQPDVAVESPAGVRVEPWSSAFAADRAAFTRSFAVRVDADAAEGERAIRVTAVVGAARVDGSLRLIVRKPPP